jgi:steroid delta-isomerase-like uncharacterized protein
MAASRHLDSYGTMMAASRHLDSYGTMMAESRYLDSYGTPMMPVTSYRTLSPRELASSTTAEANKQLVREHYEQLVNRKNLAAADVQLAPDFIDHAAPPGTPRGPEAARLAMAGLHHALPDVWVTLEDVVAEGDRVAVRATWRGTHQGTFQGLTPSGRKVTLTGMVFWRVANGRIAERWATVDLRELFQHQR